LTEDGRKTRFIILLLMIRVLEKLRTPKLLSWLQALSTDLLVRGAFGGSNPSDSELCLIPVVLNFDLVSNFHIASVTAQSDTLLADIESMRKVDILAACHPESDRHDRLRSLRISFRGIRSS
jgi:hypothetical protein